MRSAWNGTDMILSKQLLKSLGERNDFTRKLLIHSFRPQYFTINKILLI